jgi:hypothetical protein
MKYIDKRLGISHTPWEQTRLVDTVIRRRMSLTSSAIGGQFYGAKFIDHQTRSLRNLWMNSVVRTSALKSG